MSEESSPARSQSIDSLEAALKNTVTMQGKNISLASSSAKCFFVDLIILWFVFLFII